jgi:regulatory protein
MASDEEHRSALRSYDEFEGRRRKKRRPARDEGGPEASRPLRCPDALKLSEDSLREAALRYLDKQDASVDQVRRVLRRRVYKYGDEQSMPSAYDEVERLLARFIESKILDDQRYASALAESQRRRGASLAKVRQKLRARGLADEHMETALEALSTNEELTDEASASTYARKRRLLERYDIRDPKQREKALASLARQGFSFEVARQVLGI